MVGSSEEARIRLVSVIGRRVREEELVSFVAMLSHCAEVVSQRSELCVEEVKREERRDESLLGVAAGGSMPAHRTKASSV